MALSPGTDNIVVALRQSNRIRKVVFSDLAEDWQLEKVLAAMEVPFPELTELRLFSNGETLPHLPDSFLGGYAPRLRNFELDDISFPWLPKLLLSPNHLICLHLSNIPITGYISPEMMVALLCALSSLETLQLEFRDRLSHPAWERLSPPPPKQFIFPVLDEFHFKGVTGYLEDLVTFIDAPQLDHIHITFFNQIYFDTPRLAQFINRTITPRPRDKARVQFENWSTSIAARSRTLEIGILCTDGKQNSQLSSIAQVFNSPLPLLSTVEDLFIEHEYPRLIWKNDATENTLWVQLLLPFTAVKNLYLSKEFAPGIAAVLQELVRDRPTEVLPSLQNIFVEGLELLGPFRENIEQFIAARQLSGRPVIISVRNEPIHNDGEEEEESTLS